MKINETLKEVASKINPSKEELKFIDKFVKNFIQEAEKKLKQQRIKAEIFVGGSFAKKTLIKKGQYDIDIFFRFDEKYKQENISKLALNAISRIKGIGKISTIHGSRDYYKINSSPLFFIEVIPVIKVKNPKNAENVTDLSYSHVNYIKKRLNTEKMLNEVRLAKAFCHATNCYGAESYIHGFSGYAIELLVYHYGGFFSFVKGIEKIKNKEIIDIEKLYKNKNEILMDMNSAKTESPIILIDPTYQERNALAALSRETLEKFKKECARFLKNPSEKFFEDKKINLEKMKENVKKNGYEFILLEAKTDKQEGDIAGSKLIKFYRHLGSEINKLYELKQNEFEYGGKKEAKYFFAVKKRNERIIFGPHSEDKKNVEMFKRKHREVFAKGDRIYAREKITKKISEFISFWKIKNREKIKEMGITELRLK